MTLTVCLRNPAPRVAFRGRQIYRKPVVPGSSAPDVIALAAAGTAVLRAALADMGIACPAAEAEVIRAGNRSHLVLYLAPDIPWGDTQAAAVRVVARLRELDADLRLEHATFEALPRPR